jgi:DNA-binding MarR family transcriptional regulator
MTTKAPQYLNRDPDMLLRGLVGYNLKRTSNALSAIAATALEPFSLRITTFSALSVICTMHNITPAQLAASLTIERSNIAQIITTLEQEGLITRHAVPNDKRSHTLRPTQKGRVALKHALAAIEAQEARALTGLSTYDAAQLVAVLNRIEYNINGGADE